VNRVQIIDIEAGRKTGSVETLRKLAQELGIDIDDLVSTPITSIESGRQNGRGA
jgi:transcriptional regulator with XRE-family HTH domain